MLNDKNQDNHFKKDIKLSEKKNNKETNEKKTKSNQYYKNKQFSVIPKGDLLEYRIKRLIFFMGYFPKVGVIIKTSTDEQGDMITDLDVYGFYIHKNFVSKNIWADCKAGKARPLERISWLIGVKKLVGVEDVIFVKKGVRTGTRQFARKAGIQILDLEILNELESKYNIKTDDWRGSWNPYVQLKQIKIFQNITNDSIFKKIGNLIYCNYWSFDNYTKVKKVITALTELAEIEQYPLQMEQIKSVYWTIFELINLFVLAILNICKEIYYFSDKDKKDTIIDGLISGEISAKKRTEIINATYKIAYGIILQNIPDFDVPLNMPKLEIKPPKYFKILYDLILRITRNPLDYFDILRFLDFTFMEYDLQSKQIDEEVLKDMFPNYDNLVISAKTIIHFICDITGIRKNIFNLMK